LLDNIECFEIIIERFRHLLARCSTSDPKNLNNEKFFDNIREGDQILDDRGWLGTPNEQQL
jgi:hypothetical protein